jgi:pSer/pThr/pTyr-binding forkhead associated (FHA) protein
VPESLLTILKLAFLALLWLFFLRVLRAVWHEIREPAGVAVGAAVGAAAPRQSAPVSGGRATSGPATGGVAAALKVLEPPEDAGKVFPLAEEITVGRGGGCGVPLTTDKMVSQLHARVFRTATGELFVEDLGSTNGTTLNRAKVSGPVRMKRGDRLQVGRTVMEVT